MAMLSPEINRLLGYALLDPDLAKRIFNGDRAIALQGFNLRPEEKATILASQACTLPDLSHELSDVLATPDMFDAEADFERLYQSYRLVNKASLAHVQSVVQRAIYELSPVVQQPAGSSPEAAEFTHLKTAS